MEIWIAKLLGPVILVLAVPMIVKPENIDELNRRFLEDRPLMLISGVLVMVAGLSIINSYNVWKWDWTLIITLFGWALTLSGASRILMPHFVAKAGDKMTDRSKMTVIAGVFWAVLGAFLMVKGYLS